MMPTVTPPGDPRFRETKRCPNPGCAKYTKMCQTPGCLGNGQIATLFVNVPFVPDRACDATGWVGHDPHCFNRNRRPEDWSEALPGSVTPLRSVGVVVGAAKTEDSHLARNGTDG